jgi:hypothetical protein
MAGCLMTSGFILPATTASRPAEKIIHWEIDFTP